MTLILLIAPFTDMKFLSHALNFTLIYYWGRKSKHIVVLIMGVLPIRACYLPYFFLLISLVSERELITDLIGIFVGHVIFYFNEIFPRLECSKGYKPLGTPRLVRGFIDMVGLNNDIDFVEEFEEVGALF